MTGTKILGVPDDLHYQPIWNKEHKFDFSQVERNSTPEKADMVFSYLKAMGIEFSTLRLLDLGCNEGYFLFEAIHLGAEAVFGVDYFEPAVKIIQKLQKELQIKNLTIYQQDLNDLTALKRILSTAKPTVILLNSILHHLPNFQRWELVRYCSYASNILIFEFDSNDLDKHRQYIESIIDTRIKFCGMPNGWYNNKTANDYLGVKRAMALYFDPRCDRKWIQFHDNQVLNRFEVRNGMLFKYNVEGPSHFLIESRPYYPGKLLWFTPRTEIQNKPRFREQLWVLLKEFAKRHMLHCELVHNIILYMNETNQNIVPIDFETCFDLRHFSYLDFFNTHIRINPAIGKVDNMDCYHTGLPFDLISDIDIDHINAILFQFHCPLISDKEYQVYHQILGDITYE